MKKQLFTIAMLADLLIACASEEQHTSNAALSVPVVTVAAANAEVYKEYPATIEGLTEVEIRPQVAGILEKIYVDEGAQVNAGQPLFKIDERPYREQFNKANAELLAARAAAANAELEVNKIQPLVESKVVSEVQLKTVQSNYDMALARVKQVEAQVADARINMDYTLIKAPTPGFIGLLNKKAGSLLSVSDAKELTTLSNIREVHVYFSLSEQEFADIKRELPGETIEEKLKHVDAVALVLAGSDQYPEAGKLDMVNGGFDKNSGAVAIRASFPNEKGLLRSGNTGKIRLTFVKNNIISIPQSATTSIQDKVFVYTVGDSSKVHKQMISVSGRSGNNFLVTDGLKSGDKLVVEGIEGLQEGTKVDPASTKLQAALK